MSWLSGLSATARPSSAATCAHLRLFQAAQGKAQEIQLVAGGGEQEVALVAGRIDGAVQVGGPPGRAIAAHIVAGGQGRGAQVAGHLQQVAELDRLVAAHAGDRRLAAQIGVGEILDHRVAEAAFVVEHIVGDADGLGGGAGVEDVLAGAAGALLLHRRAMVVELQGDADHVIAGALEQGGGDGGIHAAGHGRHHPRAGRQGRGVARGPLDIGVDVHGEAARGEHGRSLR